MHGVLAFSSALNGFPCPFDFPVGGDFTSVPLAQLLMEPKLHLHLLEQLERLWPGWPGSSILGCSLTSLGFSRIVQWTLHWNLHFFHQEFLQPRPQEIKVTKWRVTWWPFDFINHPLKAPDCPQLMKQELSKHPLIWPFLMGNAIENFHDLSWEFLQVWSWVAMQFHNGLRSDQRPTNTIQVKVTRDHLKHCTTARSGPFTSARLDITSHLELQIWNAFQPFDKLRSQPTIQTWNKPGRTSTKLSCVDFEGTRNPERQIIWPTNIQATQQQNQTVFPTSKVWDRFWHYAKPWNQRFLFRYSRWGTILNQFFFFIIFALTIIARITPKRLIGKTLTWGERRGTRSVSAMCSRWTGIGWRPCSTASTRFDMPSNLADKDWIASRLALLVFWVSRTTGWTDWRTRAETSSALSLTREALEAAKPACSCSRISREETRGLIRNFQLGHQPFDLTILMAKDCFIIWTFGNLNLQLTLDQRRFTLKSPKVFAQTKGCLVLGLARLVQGFKHTLQVLDLLTCSSWISWATPPRCNARVRDSSKRRWASATTAPKSWGLTPRWTVWVL